MLTMEIIYKIEKGALVYVRHKNVLKHHSASIASTVLKPDSSSALIYHESGYGARTPFTAAVFSAMAWSEMP